MSGILDGVRGHLGTHFAHLGEPDAASVTFLGVDSIEVLRFGPDDDGVVHYASLGCSRYGMGDDPVHGPRAEVLMSLRGNPGDGLARSVAVIAAAPAVEGLVLAPDALVDLGQPLWQGASFTAVLVGDADVAELGGPQPVGFLACTPITQTEAAWVRLKGAEAMRLAWQQDGVDVLDIRRRAASPS